VDEATVTAWATSLGKASTPLPKPPLDAHNGHHLLEHGLATATQVVTAEQEEQVGERPTGETSPRLQWTAEMDAQLTQAFEASSALSIKETIDEIAQHFTWPVNSVKGRVYKLQLNEKRRPTVHPHERESVGNKQEGD